MRAKRTWRAVLGAPLGGVRYRHDYEVVDDATVRTDGRWWIHLSAVLLGGKNDGRAVDIPMSVPEARNLRDRLDRLIKEAENKERVDVR